MLDVIDIVAISIMNSNPIKDVATAISSNNLSSLHIKNAADAKLLENLSASEKEELIGHLKHLCKHLIRSSKASS